MHVIRQQVHLTQSEDNGSILFGHPNSGPNTLNFPPHTGVIPSPRMGVFVT